MLFTTLPTLANFIRRTHSRFAILKADKCLTILGKMNAAIMNDPAMCGATFRAVTNAEHGIITTYITINKLPSGAWEYIEVAA